jgi:hypothetical protein
MLNRDTAPAPVAVISGMTPSLQSTPDAGRHAA